MISNIYIKNFKAFKHADLNLSNLNVLAGSNGVGKSSFIQSLLLLRQSFNARMLPNNGLQLNGEYVQIGTGTDALSMNFDATSEDNIEIVFGIEWANQDELFFHFGYEANTDILPIVYTEGVEKITNKALFTNRFKYLSADRISPEPDNESGVKLFPASDFHIKRLRTLGKRGEYTVHYLAITDDDISFEQLAHPKARSMQIGDQVSAWLGEISYGISQTSTYLPDSKAAKLSYRYTRLLSKDGRETYTQPIKPQNVGFGVTYVLPVITLLLSAQKGDLVIIENPESHLHPAGQAAIGRLCALAAANGVQVIIETHSDHILNAIRVAVRNKDIKPDEVLIAFFERNEWEHTSQIIVPNIDDLGRLDKKPKGFFDEYDKQLDNLLR